MEERFSPSKYTSQEVVMGFQAVSNPAARSVSRRYSYAPMLDSTTRATSTVMHRVRPARGPAAAPRIAGEEPRRFRGVDGGSEAEGEKEAAPEDPAEPSLERMIMVTLCSGAQKEYCVAIMTRRLGHG